MITSAQNTQVKNIIKLEGEGQEGTETFCGGRQKDVSGSPGESDRQDLCGRVYA